MLVFALSYCIQIIVLQYVCVHISYLKARQLENWWQNCWAFWRNSHDLCKNWNHFHAINIYIYLWLVEILIQWVDLFESILNQKDKFKFVHLPCLQVSTSDLWCYFRPQVWRIESLNNSLNQSVIKTVIHDQNNSYYP